MAKPEFARLWGRLISVPSKPDADMAERVTAVLRDVDRLGVASLPIAPFYSSPAHGNIA